jgi:hypothetical protein
MEAIEAVLDLAKERDDAINELETYESWFEELVGKEVTMKHTSKKKTKFIDCTVTAFHTGEGWELTATDVDDVFMVTFEDFVSGNAWLKNHVV